MKTAAQLIQEYIASKIMASENPDIEIIERLRLFAPDDGITVTQAWGQESLRPFLEKEKHWVVMLSPTLSPYMFAYRKLPINALAIFSERDFTRVATDGRNFVRKAMVIGPSMEGLNLINTLVRMGNPIANPKP